MLLLVDNSKLKKENDIDDISFTIQLKKALHSLSIPFIIFETWKDDPESIPKGITHLILSGSKVTLSKEPKHPIVLKNMEIIRKFSNLPILGICFGCQVLTQYYHYGVHHTNLKSYFTKKMDIHHKKMELFDLWKPDSKGKKMSQFYFSDYPNYSQALNKKTVGWFEINKGLELPCAWNYREKHYGLLFHPEASKSSYPIFEQFAKL